MAPFANPGWSPHRLPIIGAACAAAALLSALLLATCAGPSSSNGVGGTGDVDSIFSDLAVGSMAGSASSGDSSTGVGLVEPPGRLNWSSHVASLFAIEQIAQAASFSCMTAASWTNNTGTTIQYNPATNCTVTYANGVVGPYDVVGSWTFTFSGAGSSAMIGGAVSNNPAGTVVTRTATLQPGPPATTTVTQNYTGPLHDMFSVTEDTTNCAPYTGSVPCGGVQVTCGGTGCPYSGNPSGTRSIDLLGFQITGTKNGKTFYNHTVATTAPIVVTGLGKNRVISSGTIVVYHNLEHITLTTVINGPLHHELGCAYPIDGSVTTSITGAGAGSDNGKTETLTFTGKCGIGTVLNPDGTSSTVALHLVL